MADFSCSIVVVDAERCLEAMGDAECDAWHERAGDLMYCESLWTCRDDTGR